MINLAEGNVMTDIYTDTKDIIKKAEIVHKNRGRYTYSGKDLSLQRILTGDGEVIFRKIKARAFRRDKKMRAIKEYNRKRGIKTVFISGYAINGDSIVRGFAHKGTAYIMYDHPYYTPEQINHHEMVHLKANDAAYKKFYSSVFCKLTTDEKSKILMALNKKYAPQFIKSFLRANPDATSRQTIQALILYLSEEAMADLNGGMDEMAEHSARFADEILTFRAAADSAVRDTNFTEEKCVMSSELRLSVEYSGSPNEPQNKKCVAIHNVSAENFLRMYNKGYGGMPGISAAILYYTSCFTDYGALSFVLKPDSINPQNQNNLIFSSDAWSSMFPSVVMKPNKKAVEKLAKRLGASALQIMNNYFENKSEATALQYLSEEKAIKELFIKEKGGLRKSAFEELDEWDSEFAEELTPMIKRGVTADDIIYKDELTSEFFDKLGFVIDRMGEYDFGRPNKRLLAFARDGNKEAQNLFRKDWLKYTKGSVEGYILNHQREFNKFVKNIISDVSQGEVLKDREGNIYDDNVDNILKIMFEIDKYQFANYESIDNLTAKLAKKYTSLNELRADTDKLLPLSDDIRQSVADKLNNRLSGIIDKIATPDEFGDSIKNTGNILLRAINGNGGYSEESVIQSFKKENIEVNENTANEIITLFDNIKTAPVKFFEAKLNRLLKWNEVGAAVIPDNTDAEVAYALFDLGIKVVKYEFENNDSRLKAVEQFPEMRFSREEYLKNQTGDESHAVIACIIFFDFFLTENG
ncbi:MAG: hypothetical protein IJT38_02820 [Clostridia bacterium]|nr:hypothetical protein [Clostridia bacterium]